MALRTLALSGGVALHAINVYVATTIMPSVVSDIGGIEFYAWNTTLFVVASIAGSVLSPALLQAGPRLSYVIAALTFGMGTVICAAAPNMHCLLLGRTVQGLGGGFLFALSYAMIRIVYDEGLWPRAMALVSGMWGVATLVGPAVGGVFSELHAWRWAFWVMVPASLAFAVLAYISLPARANRHQNMPKVPIVQLALLTAAIVAVSVGSLSPRLVWNAVGLGSCLILFAALLVYETRASCKVLPSGSLSLRQQTGLLFAMMSLLAVAVTSSEIFAPLFLQILHAQSPLVAGYVAASMAAGWTIGAILSSGANGHSIPRIIVAAPAVQLTGMIALAPLLSRPTAGGPVIVTALAFAMLLVGFGVGLGWPHLLTGVIKAAPEAEKDLATSAITSIQHCATAVGAALAGLVVNSAGLSSPGGVGGASTAAFALFAFFAMAPLAAILAAVRLRRLQRTAHA